jgi:hypothetical protein
VTYTDKEIASVAWAANAELQAMHGDPAPSLPGDIEDAEAHAVTLAGIRAILAGASPGQLHETWMRSREAQGWTLGPTKDSGRKTHPALVAYADLPEHQRVKDRVFIAIVLAMAGDGCANADTDTPEPLIVSEDPVLNGPRLSWYASMRKAEFHHDTLTASRDGVLPDGNTYLHQIPSSWLSAAVRAHRLLREGKAGEALAMATHERFDGRIVEVAR